MANESQPAPETLKEKMQRAEAAADNYISGRTGLDSKSGLSHGRTNLEEVRVETGQKREDLDGLCADIRGLLPENLKGIDSSSANFRAAMHALKEGLPKEMIDKNPGLPLSIARVLRFNAGFNKALDAQHMDLATAEAKLVMNRMTASNAYAVSPELVAALDQNRLTYDRFAPLPAVTPVAAPAQGAGANSASAPSQAPAGVKAAPEAASVMTGIDQQIMSFCWIGAAHRTAANHSAGEAVKSRQESQEAMKKNVIANLEALRDMNLDVMAQASPKAAAQIEAFSKALAVKLGAVAVAGQEYEAMGDVRNAKGDELTKARISLLETQVRQSSLTPEERSKYSIDLAAFEENSKQNSDAIWDLKMDQALVKLYDTRQSLHDYLLSSKDASGAPITGAKDALETSLDGIALEDPVLQYMRESGAVPSEAKQRLLSAPSSIKYSQQEEKTVAFLMAQQATMLPELQKAFIEGTAVSQEVIKSLKSEEQRAYANLINLFNGADVIEARDKGGFVWQIPLENRSEHIKLTYFSKLLYHVKQDTRITEETGKLRENSDKRGKDFGPDMLAAKLDKAIAAGDIRQIARAWEDEEVLSTNIGREKNLWQKLGVFFSSENLSEKALNMGLSYLLSWGVHQALPNVFHKKTIDRGPQYDGGNDGNGGGGSGGGDTGNGGY